MQCFNPNHHHILSGLGQTRKKKQQKKKKKKTMNYQSRLMVLVLYSLFFISNNNNHMVDSYLGINWGRIASQRILPSMVVDLILQNGIPEVKVFSSTKNVLTSFIGTDIGVTVSIPNDDLKKINSVNDAIDWINVKLLPYVQMAINLRYITIGYQPFSQPNKIYFEAVEVLDFMQRAIDEIGPALGKNVKVTVDHYVDVMKKGNMQLPSRAEFVVDLKDVMKRSTEILVKHNAPISLDMFPFYSARTMFTDTEFAFFDNNSTLHFMDGEYNYTNIFEVVYDMFVCSLEKLGFPNVKIVVGQVGWPTDGIYEGSMESAERFNRGLIKYVMSGKGTPRRPGPIDVYLHSLTDENQVKVIRGGERGGFIRHWGIYRFDGKPKYHLDFSGKDRDINPVSAKGVTHMPNRWCVFNQRTNDTSLLHGFLVNACKYADCTPMEDGGTCSHLPLNEKISYAFNVFFQEKSQKLSEMGCDFDGYGMITPVDPSAGTCKFPVEILAAEEISESHSDRHISVPPVITIILVPMLSYTFFNWL